MARPLFDSPYLFGIHEPGGERHMLEAGKPGWVLFTEGIGADPNDRGGANYTAWSNQGLGVICRLNNGYEPAGTIPLSTRYEDFARRSANFVAASQGCKIWIIGNEMNFIYERPRRESRSTLADEPPGMPRERSDRFSALRAEGQVATWLADDEEGREGHAQYAGDDGQGVADDRHP